MIEERGTHGGHWRGAPGAATFCASRAGFDGVDQVLNEYHYEACQPGLKREMMTTEFQQAAAEAGWGFERIDERTISVTSPTFSTPVEVSLNSSDRRVLAFYGLACDLMGGKSHDKEQS